MNEVLDQCAAGLISPQIAVARLTLSGTPIDGQALARAPEGSPLREVAPLHWAAV